MADLDITGRVRVDASQAEGEFRRLGGAADRMSRDIGASSGRAGRSIDSIGAGASQSAEQLTRSQARIRDEIARTTTQIQQLGKTASQKFEIKIAAQGLDPAQFAPYLRRLREVEAAQASQAAGAVRAAQSTAASSAAMARASGAAGELGNALRGLAAAYGVGQLISQTDQYTKFTAQLRLASSSTSDYANSLASVRSISTQSQQDIGAVGVLYARVANSTRELGVSQKQVGDIVKSVALSLSVSGATAAESASAILQLSQSFASGTLRGEEFNAVNEAAPRLMKALAEGMGVPIGKLKEMASEGLITSAVLAQALPKALGELNEEAKEVTTISGAFTVFNNELMQFVGASAKSSGAVKLITDSIVSLSENLNVLAAGGIGVVVAKVSAAIGGLAIKTTEGAAAALAAANAAGVQRAALIASAQAEVASAAATSSRLTVTNAMLAVSRQEAAASLASANATAAQATAQIAAARAAGAQSFALAVLAEGEVALLAAQQARSASMAELALLGQQQARVSAQITAATLAQTAAQAGLTAANAAGGAAASLATRALGFLGGPIGIITTLLGFAATAWVLWGSSAKKGEAEATGAVESSTGEIITALDRQISKLKERNALARAGLPEIAKGASEASQRLGELQVQLDNLQSGKGPTGGAALPEAARVAVLQATLREYGTLAGKIKEADAQQRSLDDFGKTAKAGEWLKKYATNSEKLTEELAQARKELGDAFSPEIEKRIRAQYDTKDAGAKKAAAAVAKEQSTYDNLIANIREKIAADQLELQVGEKLTETQKIRAKFESDILTKRVKLSGIRQQEIRAELDELAASELALTAHQNLAKADIEAAKSHEKYITSLDAGLDKIKADAAAQIDATARMGLSKDAIAALDSAKLEMLATDLELQAIKALDRNLDEATYNALKQQAAAYRDLAKAKQGGAAKETALDLEKANADAAKKADEEWRKTADGINQSLTDALLRGFESGKDFAKNLRDTVINMFKTMVLRPVISAIISPVAGALTGALGLSGAARAGQSGGGVGDIISTASNAYNMLNKGVSSGIEAGFSKFATSSAGQSLGLSSAGVAGNNPSAFVGPQLTATGSQMGAALGVVGNTLAGYAMGSMAKSLISGGYSVSGGMETLQKVGTAVGSALGGPVVGAIVGGAAGVVNRLFGRKLKDSGIEGNFGGASGFEGNSYQYLKGGLFRSDKTKRGELDDGLQDYLSQSFKLLQTQTGAFAETLGLQSDKVASFTSAIKLSLKDLDEKEATAALEGAVKQAGNDLAQTVLGGNTFAKAGEEASATLARLAVSLSATNGWLDTLGLTLRETSLASAAASSTFIEMFGSVDAFTASMSSYYENFYSEAEKTANVTRDVAAALADVGLQMPTTRDEFRALVEAQMALGDSGTGAVAALLGVSGAFASVTAASETAAEAAARLAADAAARLADEQNKAAEAAEAAARRAQEVARERYDIETELYNLLGDTTKLRERELDALDASNRALKEYIYSLQDAFAAVDSAFGTVQRSISAAKAALQKDFDAGQKQRQQAQSDAQATSGLIDGISKAIANALSAQTIESQQFDNMRRAQAQAQLDGFLASLGAGDSATDLQGLDRTLGTLGKDSRAGFGTFEDYAFDRGVTAGKLAELGQLADAQKTVAEQTLEQITAGNEADIAAYEAQQSALDATLAQAQSMYDAIKGVDNSVLSVAAAMQQFSETLINLDAIKAQRANALRQSGASPEFIVTGQYRDFMGNLVDIYNGQSQEFFNALGKSGTAAVSSLQELKDRLDNLGNAGVWEEFASGLRASEKVYDGVSYTTVVDKNGGQVLTGGNFNPDLSAAEKLASEQRWLANNFVPQYEQGTPYVPNDGLAFLHKGERVIPAQYNTPGSLLQNGGASNAEIAAALRAMAARLDAIEANTRAAAGHTAATHRQLVRIAPNDIVQTEVAA